MNVAHESGSLVDHLTGLMGEETSTYHRQAHTSIINPGRSAPVILRVIQARVCNGKRLRVADGRFYGIEGSDGERWVEVRTVAACTGEDMGKRWLKRGKEGGWDVRSARP